MTFKPKINNKQTTDYFLDSPLTFASSHRMATVLFTSCPFIVMASAMRSRIENGNHGIMIHPSTFILSQPSHVWVSAREWRNRMNCTNGCTGGVLLLRLRCMASNRNLFDYNSASPKILGVSAVWLTIEEGMLFYRILVGPNPPIHSSTFSFCLFFQA